MLEFGTLGFRGIQGTITKVKKKKRLNPHYFWSGQHMNIPPRYFDMEEAVLVTRKPGAPYKIGATINKHAYFQDTCGPEKPKGDR